MEIFTASLQSLSERVARLEMQNRRLKKGGVTVLILAFAVMAMGQAQPRRVLEANEFVLKDAAGRMRARLSMEMTNRPTLTFYSENGGIPASLAGGDEPFLTLNRTESKQQVVLGVATASRISA
jgi:hypothetical protein